MFSRLEECLQRIYSAKLLKNNNQYSIDFEKRVAMRLIESMTIDELCSYRNTLGQNFAFLFTQVDYIEGIEYIAKHNKELLKKLLFDKAKNGAIPFVVGMRTGAEKCIRFIIKNYSDKKAELFANELQEATINNDIEKVKDILKSLDKVPTDKFGSDPLEDAVLLNYFELVQLFFEDDKLHSQFTLFPALEAAIFSDNKQIITYFINKLIERNEIDALQQTIDRIYNKHLLTLSFVKLYTNILAHHTQLTIDTKMSLLKVPTQFILKANYDSDKEFVDIFKQIRSIIVDDKDAKKHFKSNIASIIRSEPQRIPYQRWYIRLPTNVKIDLIVNLSSLNLQPLVISLHEKCDFHPYLACQDMFDAKERAQLLEQSMTSKHAAAFHYFLNKKNLTHHGDLNNNLAHFAAMADFDVAVYTLYNLNQDLFKEENADHKLPLALLPNNSPLKTLMDPEWQTYHTIKAAFVSQKCFFNTLIEDPKWGTVPCHIAEYLTQIEKAIAILGTSKLNPVPLKACYLEISEYLFYTLELLWTSQKCNTKAMNELLIKYCELGKVHSLLEKRRLLLAASLFSRYENNELALALTKALLKTEITPSKPSRVKVNFLRLTLLGLYASKMFNMKLISPYYSDADLGLTYDQEFLKSILFRVLASTDSITNISENERNQFAENIKTLDVTPAKSTKSVLEAHNAAFFKDYIEACGVMLNWANRFFDLSKEQMAQYKNALSVIELKILFLEKLKFLLTSLPYMQEVSLAPLNSCLNIKTRLQTYTTLISTAIESAQKSKTEIKKEMHASNAKKPPATKSMQNPAPSPVQSVPAPQVAPTRKIIDYAIFPPSIFDQYRFAIWRTCSNQLTSDTRLQPRFFTPKTTDYATKHDVEALDLAPSSDRIYFNFKQYCDMILELSHIISHYLKAKSPPDERASHFIKLTERYASSEPNSRSVHDHKKKLSDLIAWFASEQAALQQERSTYINDKQQLEQSMDWYMSESNHLKTIIPNSSLVTTIDNISYFSDLGYAQSVNQQNLDITQENLNLVCNDIADTEDGLRYFESHASKLLQAQNLLNRKLAVESVEDTELTRKHGFR